MYKKLQFLLLTVFLLSLTNTFAEVKTIVIDAPNSAVSTFYSFENGVVKQDSVANWDLAFMTGMDAGIRINDLASLWLVPTKGIDAIGKALDTTGMSSWQQLYNSDTTFNIGAFNLGLDGFDSNTGDYGWGSYNPATHFTLGTKLYVIKYGNSYKQIAIDLLAGSAYTIKFADLDGKNYDSVDVDKTTFGERQFVYYSLKNKQMYDREPAASAWDLVWGKYATKIQDQSNGSTLWYTVAGFHQNVRPMSIGAGKRTPAGIRVAQVDSVDFNNVITPSDEKFGGMINEIGDDWKTYVPATNTYTPHKVIYFAQRFDNKGIASGNIYKLSYLGYVGGKNVSTTFSQEKVTVNTVEDNNVLTNFGIYPSLINKGEQINLVYSAKSTDSKLNFSIINVLGETIATYSFANSQEFSALNLPTENLTTGLYYLVFENQKNNAIKFIVR